jgi:hypothetical protein
MVYLLAFTLTTLSLIVFYRSYSLLRAGAAFILPFAAMVFSMRVSVGLGILPLLDLSNITFVGESLVDHLVGVTDPILYIRQAISHLIALAILFFGMHFSPYKSRQSFLDRQEAFSPYLLVGLAWLAIGILSYVKFFVLGPGLDLLRETQLFHSSVESAVAHRIEGRRQLELGQGTSLAMLGSYIFFPIAAFFFRKIRMSFGTMLCVVCFICSLAYTVQTRQKAPPLLTVITFLGIFFTSRNKTGSNKSFKALPRVIFVTAVAVPLGILSYGFNFGLGASEAVSSFLIRTFIVPGAAEGYFYYVFPENAGFRGIEKVFYMPAPLVAERVGDYSVEDVAVLATGDRFSANASFIAVAWSGGGYAGVALGALAFCLATILLDLWMRKLGYNDRIAVLALSVPAVNALTSGAIVDYISTGGMIIPFFITASVTFILHATKRYSPLRVMQPAPDRADLPGLNLDPGFKHF